MSVDKPYDVQLYPNADAVLAVYGCKGSTIDPTQAFIDGTTMSDMSFGPNISAGVEVIFGVFGASGKLPINIPELDFETLSYTDKITYSNGYGITYNSLLKSSDDENSKDKPNTVDDNNKIENAPLFVINNAHFAVFWAIYDGENFLSTKNQKR